jgi:hypothetical protein
MESENATKKRRLSTIDSNDVETTVSAKTPRNVDILPGTTLKLEYSKDIYMKDGNVVLAAGSTAFKVHKGILARHSVVFRDMFQAGSANVDTVKFKGRPVVVLHDNPEALASLLKTLYDLKLE